MKKILLPVDESIHSIHALKYMMWMSSVLEDFTYMLFYVQPVISDYIKEEAQKNPQTMARLTKLEKENEVLGKDILNRHTERLLAADVPEDRIVMSTQKRHEGLARDIIHQAWHAPVDAVAMGRRGFSRFQDTFIGSITKNVVEHNAEIPVWVIDGEITSKKILLAVDGSSDAFKALSHLCDMLRPDPDVTITILHIQPSLKDCCGIEFHETQSPEEKRLVSDFIETTNRQCIDHFMERAWRKFKEKGINEDIVKIKSESTLLSVGKTIVEEFRNGHYGTLVVGKRGVNKRFFMGSVSNYLVTHMEKGALWVVP